MAPNFAGPTESKASILELVIWGTLWECGSQCELRFGLQVARVERSDTSGRGRTSCGCRLRDAGGPFREDVLMQHLPLACMCGSHHCLPTRQLVYGRSLSSLASAERSGKRDIFEIPSEINLSRICASSPAGTTYFDLHSSSISVVAKSVSSP